MYVFIIYVYKLFLNLQLIGFVDPQCYSVGLTDGLVDSPSIVLLDSNPMVQLIPKVVLLDSPIILLTPREVVLDSRMVWLNPRVDL